MGLNVYLIDGKNRNFVVAANFLDQNGFNEEAQFLRRHAESITLWHSSITHNLVEMAKKAGIYQACWCPEELSINKAEELIPLLKNGLEKLKDNPVYYEQFNAKNGRGNYSQFVSWVKKYLEACKTYPEAIIDTIK